MSKNHSHNLSVNSVLSIAEPTTPPQLKLWESSKLSATLALPSFSLDEKLYDLQLNVKHRDNDKLGDRPRQRDADKIRDTSRLRDVVRNERIHRGGARSSSENSSFDLKIDKDYLALVSKVPLAQLQGDILRMARDQHGCRFLQKRIDDTVVTNPQTRVANFEVIFSHVCLLWYELIVDPFGNYLIQKLVDYCDAEKLDGMLLALQHQLYAISVNQHGTRALQKMIDRMSTLHQLSVLVGGLRPYIIDLIKDLNGNHVIQKILNKYLPENCQFIYDAIIDDLLVVATHKHGCCVLQKCLNHVNAAQLTAFSLVILSYDVFTKLVNDQFGNYVLQYLVSIDSLDVNGRLYGNIVRYGIDRLCNLKFSSNVVEKLMKNCYTNEPRLVGFSDLKFTMILLILQCDISKLINDPYGNYVVQTLVDILINPAVSYYVDLPVSGTLLPSLLMLLMDNYRGCPDSLQVQIIKIWFQHCKIVSSFGKRIQLKINIILNGLTKTRKPLNNQGNLPFDNQNMTANGEFVKANQSLPMLNRYQSRSMSMDNLAHMYKGMGVPSYGCATTQHENYYGGYALNRGMLLGTKAAPRSARFSYDSYDPARSATFTGDAFANLHISTPPNSTVPYAKVNQTIPGFGPTEFVGGASESPYVAEPGVPLAQFQDRYRGGSTDLGRNPAFRNPTPGRFPPYPGHQRHVSDSAPFNMLGNLGLFQD